MAVRVSEVETPVVAWAAVNFNAGSFEGRLYVFVVAGFEPKRHVVHLVAGVDFSAASHLEQRHLLITATEETLPGTLMSDLESKYVYVELLRPREVLDMQNDVVYACDFECASDIFSSMSERFSFRPDSSRLVKLTCHGAGESEEVSRFLDHSSLAVTTTYLRRLEGQQDKTWLIVARHIGL